MAKHRLTILPEGLELEVEHNASVLELTRAHGLDIGAGGIVVPHVNTRAEAQAVRTILSTLQGIADEIPVATFLAPSR